jgi:hypothetical protein
MTHDENRPSRKVRPLQRFASLTLAQIWIAIIAGSVGSGLTLLVAKLSSEPSIADQIQHFEEQQGQQGYTPVTQLSGDLRGDGTTTYVFVMRSETAARSQGFHGPSDRLFVLDDDGGSLKVSFEFQPAGQVASTSQLKQALKGKTPAEKRAAQAGLTTPDPYFARVDGTFDVSGTGTLDVAGSWNNLAMDQYVDPRPFVISWDASRQQYMQAPVLSSRQQLKYTLAKVSKPGVVARFLRSGYLDPVTLHDTSTGASFRSQDVDDYSLVNWKGHSVLVAAYVARAPDSADERLWQVVPYSLAGFGDPGSQAGACAYQPIFMRPNLNNYNPAEDARTTWLTSPLADRNYC